MNVSLFPQPTIIPLAATRKLQLQGRGVGHQEVNKYWDMMREGKVNRKEEKKKKKEKITVRVQKILTPFQLAVLLYQRYKFLLYPSHLRYNPQLHLFCPKFIPSEGLVSGANLSGRRGKGSFMHEYSSPR